MSLIKFCLNVINYFNKINDIHIVISKLISFNINKPLLRTDLTYSHEEEYYTVEFFICREIYEDITGIIPSLFLEFNRINIEKILDNNIYELIKSIYEKHASEINELIEKYNKGEVIGIRKLFSNLKELNNYFTILDKKREYIMKKGYVEEEDILSLSMDFSNGFLSRNNISLELVNFTYSFINFTSHNSKTIRLRIEPDEITFAIDTRDTKVKYFVKDNSIDIKVVVDELGYGDTVIELIKKGFDINSTEWDKIDKAFRIMLLTVYNIASIYSYYVMLLNEFMNEIMKNPMKYINFIKKVI